MLEYAFLFAVVFLAYFFMAAIYKQGDSLLVAQKRDKGFLYIAFLGIILISGLRSISVGPDTRQYVRHFNRVNDGVVSQLDKQFEEGYRLLTKIISFFTDEPQILLIIIAIIINIPILRLINKYSKDKFLSVILYITVGSFTFQLTGMRQAIAMSICAIAIDFVIKRKPIKFLLVIAVAFMFHRSAIMFAPVYLLGIKWVNKKKIVLSIIAVTILLLSGALFERFAGFFGYTEYLGDAAVEDGGGWTYVLIMIIALAVFIFAEFEHGKSEKDDENVKMERLFFAITVFALATYLMRYEFRVAERVSNYYRIAIIILLPNSIVNIKELKVRLVAKAGCIVLSIALFFYWLDGSKYLYSFFWK